MPSEPEIVARLHVHRENGMRVGADRIRLLKAIAEHGSISAGGNATGVNFRAAWNAVQALNNLFDHPLVISQVGGAHGGGATVTELGLAVIAGFEKLEGELNALFKSLKEGAADSGLTTEQMLWSLGMRTSARNALRGVIEAAALDAVNCEVVLRVSPDVAITAIVTRQSAEDLDLRPGRHAVALIKSSFVILASADPQLRTSARNQLYGTVIRHDVGAVNDEVVLELDAGKTLAATITRGSGEALGLTVGDRLVALIKASHVILAVD